MASTSSLPGAGFGSSSGMGMGISPSDMMAPLMLIMMEKLLTHILELTNGEETASIEPQTQTSQPDTSQRTGFGGDAPAGRPVGGVLTQAYRPGHIGLDFGIPVGTPVRTTMDGKVVYAGWNNQGYGNLVIVEQGEYKTYYAHLDNIPVKVGDQVNAGSVIGLSGNTGNSTGPHLHYEIRKNNAPLDPSPVTLNGS